MYQWLMIGLTIPLFVEHHSKDMFMIAFEISTIGWVKGDLLAGASSVNMWLRVRIGEEFYSWYIWQLTVILASPPAPFLKSKRRKGTFILVSNNIQPINVICSLSVSSINSCIFLITVCRELCCHMHANCTFLVYGQILTNSYFYVKLINLPQFGL